MGGVPSPQVPVAGSGTGHDVKPSQKGAGGYGGSGGDQEDDGFGGFSDDDQEAASHQPPAPSTDQQPPAGQSAADRLSAFDELVVPPPAPAPAAGEDEDEDGFGGFSDDEAAGAPAAAPEAGVAEVAPPPAPAPVPASAHGGSGGDEEDDGFGGFSDDDQEAASHQPPAPSTDQQPPAGQSAADRLSAFDELVVPPPAPAPAAGEDEDEDGFGGFSDDEAAGAPAAAPEAGVAEVAPPPAPAPVPASAHGGSGGDEEDDGFGGFSDDDQEAASHQPPAPSTDQQPPAGQSAADRLSAFDELVVPPPAPAPAAGEDEDEDGFGGFSDDEAAGAPAAAPEAGVAEVAPPPAPAPVPASAHGGSGGDEEDDGFGGFSDDEAAGAPAAALEAGVAEVAPPPAPAPAPASAHGGSGGDEEDDGFGGFSDDDREVGARDRDAATLPATGQAGSCAPQPDAPASNADAHPDTCGGGEDEAIEAPVSLAVAPPVHTSSKSHAAAAAADGTVSPAAATAHWWSESAAGGPLPAWVAEETAHGRFGAVALLAMRLREQSASEDDSVCPAWYRGLADDIGLPASLEACGACLHASLSSQDDEEVAAFACGKLRSALAAGPARGVIDRASPSLTFAGLDSAMQAAGTTPRGVALAAAAQGFAHRDVATAMALWAKGARGALRLVGQWEQVARRAAEACQVAASVLQRAAAEASSRGPHFASLFSEHSETVSRLASVLLAAFVTLLLVEALRDVGLVPRAAAGPAGDAEGGGDSGGEGEPGRGSDRLRQVQVAASNCAALFGEATGSLRQIAEESSALSPAGSASRLGQLRRFAEWMAGRPGPAEEPHVAWDCGALGQACAVLGGGEGGLSAVPLPVLRGSDVVGGSAAAAALAMSRRSGGVCTVSLVQLGPWVAAFGRLGLPSGAGSDAIAAGFASLGLSSRLPPSVGVVPDMVRPALATPVAFGSSCWCLPAAGNAVLEADRVAAAGQEAMPADAAKVAGTELLVPTCDGLGGRPVVAPRHQRAGTTPDMQAALAGLGMANLGALPSDLAAAAEDAGAWRASGASDDPFAGLF
ncbi:hypothetical protein FNF28_00763 [Cafeteria roenbergensis]|uniref:Uncharacterized protein n=1 Tax=Cafeteria roenbergensis TaxID=33653 RepID=A0A5A8E181_CAFRO|nr:hypothetical protein FNF28_00763 [Cafeteria roenbergensis]